MMTEGKVDILDVYTEQIKMSQKLEMLIAQIPDHENRIRTIEKWKNGIPIAGLIALGSSALTIYDSLKH